MDKLAKSAFSAEHFEKLYLNKSYFNNCNYHLYYDHSTSLLGALITATVEAQILKRFLSINSARLVIRTLKIVPNYVPELISELVGFEFLEIVEPTTLIEDSDNVLNWPPISVNELHKYPYGYTDLIRKAHSMNLSMSYASLKKVNDCVYKLIDASDESFLVAVHLKNSAPSVNMSHLCNAHLQVWLDFFSLMEKYKPNIRFIGLGDDELPLQYSALSNFQLSRSQGFSSIVDDIGLIQTADAFMGVASGPAQFAIFRNTPYLIAKNPKFHTEEMQIELGDQQSFSFAKNNQYFIRQFESLSMLKGFLQTLSEKI
jgi:hypothetical protein